MTVDETIDRSIDPQRSRHFSFRRAEEIAERMAFLVSLLQSG
jgi:hypothetical protein